MSSFRFPPPPPPPPTASSNDAQYTYNSQRGDRGGHGDHGRGRGGSVRGRGNFGGNSRGGQGRGNAYNRGGTRGGASQWQNQRHTNVTTQERTQQQSSQIPPSPNTLFTPAISYSNSNASIPTPALDTNAFTHAMSFMATPAGMQSMNAFANHMAGVDPSSTFSLHSSPSRTNHSPPGQGACKARRNERAMKWQADSKDKYGQHNQSRNQKPARAKVKAAPAVPSFGFTVPVAPKPQPPSPRREDGHSEAKRRKINLGLTQPQSTDDQKSDSEDDVDEEAAWASNEKLKNGIVFEHGGERISLQTPAEIAAWRKDRKRNFPTRQRVAEKAQEAATRRARELEFLQRISGKPKALQAQVEKKPTIERRVQNNAQNRSGGTREEPAKPLQNQNRHENIKKETPSPSSTSISMPPPKPDLGLGYETDTDASESSILSNSSILSSDSDSDSGDNSDDDAPPSSISSKIVVDYPVPPPAPPRPTRTTPKPKKEKIDMCPQWKERGTCKYGNRCKYPHTSQPKAMGLYERLVEQELEKRDRLALDAIKFLGKNGYLG